MIYLQLFWVFLSANLLGYGGGPAIIPLIRHEAVVNLGWMTDAQFAEILALGNAIPGPIAPKMAAYIGFAQGGILGAAVALFATIAPSLILMLALMGLFKRHKDSPQVQKLSSYVRPTIAVLMGIITAQNFIWGWNYIVPLDFGLLHLSILSAASIILLGRFKIHPGIIVLGALLYGAVFLAG